MPPVCNCLHERKTSKGQRSQVMLHFFEQLPLKTDCSSKLRCDAKNPTVELPTTPLSTLNSEKTFAMSTKICSTDKKSVSSNANLQFNDKDTGSSTQFQRSQNQNKSSRQRQVNAAAIDKVPKYLFSVL